MLPSPASAHRITYGDLVPVPTQLLRTTVEAASAVAKCWFEERTAIKTRAEFEKRGGLGDDRSGAVYAYFTPEDRAVYVGQTGREVKARLHDETSQHKMKPWWQAWAYMRFLPLRDESDRHLLEFLLIAAYQPTGSEKPRAKSIDSLFSEPDAAPVECNSAVARTSRPATYRRSDESPSHTERPSDMDFSPWMRFSEIPMSLSGRPGIYEIRCDAELLKVGIGVDLYKRLRNHALSRQSGLKGRRGPGPWTDPSQVESKSSVLAMHLYFDCAIAPEFNLKSQDGRRAFLETRCEVRFRVTPSRNAARSLEQAMETPDRYRYVGDVRLR